MDQQQNLHIGKSGNSKRITFGFNDERHNEIQNRKKNELKNTFISIGLFDL